MDWFCEGYAAPLQEKQLGEGMIVNNEGLILCQRFSDFHSFLLANREKFVCPDCGARLFAKFFYSFDMNKTGRAELWCTAFECDFNKIPIIVEAVNSPV